MVRHGLMCVGSAFSGKSKVTDILAQAMNLINNETFESVGVYKLNPKAITSD